MNENNEDIKVEDLLAEMRTQIGTLTQELAMQRVLARGLLLRVESCECKK